MYKVSHYINPRGLNHLAQWLGKLRDPRGKATVIRRLNRLELGQLGDHKPCRSGVWELRIDVGPGYRVYYAKVGRTLLLLLCGGSNRRQNRDIEMAIAYWRDWQRREEQ